MFLIHEKNYRSFHSCKFELRSSIVKSAEDLISAKYNEAERSSENFVKRNECFYIFDDAVIKKKLIEKHHDDSLSRHFEIQKILNLIQRKYF